MEITLDHTIVPSQDKVAAATWFAEIFGLRYDGRRGISRPLRLIAP